MVSRSRVNDMRRAAAGRSVVAMMAVVTAEVTAAMMTVVAAAAAVSAMAAEEAVPSLRFLLRSDQQGDGSERRDGHAAANQGRNHYRQSPRQDSESDRSPMERTLTRTRSARNQVECTDYEDSDNCVDCKEILCYGSCRRPSRAVEKVGKVRQPRASPPLPSSEP